MKRVAPGTSLKSAKNAASRASSSVGIDDEDIVQRSGSSAGVVAVIWFGSTTKTSVAGSPPTVTVAPLEVDAGERHGRPGGRIYAGRDPEQQRSSHSALWN